MRIRKYFGHILDIDQRYQAHAAAKVLKGFRDAGVLEVVEGDIGGTYRAVYAIRFADAVFVPHCFQKKSKRGIATPKVDLDIIRARLKVAEQITRELTS